MRAWIHVSETRGGERVLTVTKFSAAPSQSMSRAATAPAAAAAQNADAESSSSSHSSGSSTESTSDDNGQSEDDDCASTLIRLARFQKSKSRKSLVFANTTGVSD